MANTIIEQSRAGQELLNVLIPTDAVLKAYVDRYGDELMQETLKGDDEDVVEGTIVEGEIGFDSEDERLDASEEE